MNYKAEDTILYVDKINVGYEGKTILKDISIVEKNIVRDGHDSTGQTIAVLGRSGRGKSTLFKALTGLVKPMSGQILISDMKTVDKDDAKVLSEGDVGFVDQKYTLFLTEWGLLEHKDKYSCELSGGQRQRTAIIEQMLSSKHFMILDEPFSGLDVGNIEKVKTSFQKILDADEYNTIIFSTHDIRLAAELADSIYIIGKPEENSEFSTVLKHYDLKKMGLAWTPYGDGHRKLVADIKEILLKS